MVLSFNFVVGLPSPHDSYGQFPLWIYAILFYLYASFHILQPRSMLPRGFWLLAYLSRCVFGHLLLRRQMHLWRYLQSLGYLAVLATLRMLIVSHHSTNHVESHFSF